MKDKLALLFLTSLFGLSFTMRDVKDFSIEIWDYDYSLAYSTYYKINNDSLKVVIIGEVEGEREKILSCRAITLDEQASVSSFLSDFPIKKLKNKYINPLVNDGNQKRVNIYFNGTRKIIDIANFRQNDIENLFNAINLLLIDNKIKY